MEQTGSRLNLSDREKLTMTGVEEVKSFDDTAVVLRTSLGILTVEGQDLHLKNLSLEGGQAEVDGSISALIYEQSDSGGSWLSRLFR